MILSVSRRTDIPAFYSDWFYNRVKEGYAFSRNPKNPNQISKILITPEVVDCIVFWTKNPAPMLQRLHEIQNFHYYCYFALNPYNQSIECNIPAKKQMIDVFRQLSDKIGSQRVIWRYDPILLSNEIDINYHIKYFEWIAKHLSGYTNKCVFGFVVKFRNTGRNTKHTSIRELHENEALLLAKSITEIAKSYNIEAQCCAEKYDLKSAGIKHGACVDKALIEQIIACPLAAKQDKNRQKTRKYCGCIEYMDIGAYDTCLHNCLYCYANVSPEYVQNRSLKHIPMSPVLVGNVAEEDIIKERKCVSFRIEGML